jgi:hypothetical protein
MLYIVNTKTEANKNQTEITEYITRDYLLSVLTGKIIKARL